MDRPDLSRLTIPRDGPAGAIGALLGCVTRLLVLAGVAGGLVVAYGEADRRELVPWGKPLPPERPQAVAAVTTSVEQRPLAPQPLMAPVIGYVVASRKA